MAKVKLERRKHQRFAVTGKLPLQLVLDDGTELIYFPVDISKYGVGLLLERKFDGGQKLSFKFTDDKHSAVTMDVRYAIPKDKIDSEDDFDLGIDIDELCAEEDGDKASQDTEKKGMFRVGLWVLDEAFDVETAIRDYGTVYLEGL